MVGHHNIPLLFLLVIIELVDGTAQQYGLFITLRHTISLELLHDGLVLPEVEHIQSVSRLHHNYTLYYRTVSCMRLKFGRLSYLLLGVRQLHHDGQVVAGAGGLDFLAELLHCGGLDVVDEGLEG